MTYIPPDGDKVDFNLEIFDPPAGDGADFQLLEDESIVRVNAHVSLNLSTKARGTLPLALIYKVEHVEELKTSSGTWKCPHGIVDNKLLVECWGGGASGAGGVGLTRGGGAGAYAKDIINVVSNETYSFVVGTSTPRSVMPSYLVYDGRDTYWENGDEVKAVGGQGTYSKSEDALGGSADNCVGLVKYSGGNGHYGGGGGAGSTGAGKNAPLASTYMGGGTTEEYGGGGGDRGRSIGDSGEDGNKYGGGGGAGYGVSGLVSAIGGSGAPGLIRLTYDQLVAVPLVAHVSLNMGARAEAEAKSLAANRSYTDMFGIIRSRKR